MGVVLALMVLTVAAQETAQEKSWVGRTIGRVDRRMNPEIETRFVADHPEVKEIRGKVA